jgi:hypothetical protein
VVLIIVIIIIKLGLITYSVGGMNLNFEMAAFQSLDGELHCRLIMGERCKNDSVARRKP